MKITGDMVRLKRVYEEPAPEDGFRVLVDRLWPRGLSKQRAALDHFADSTGLRESVAQLVRDLAEVRRQRASLRSGEREREQRIDLLRYQVDEIRAANLAEGEEESIVRDRAVLANAERLLLDAQAGVDALDSDDGIGALAALRQAHAAIGRIAEIDPAANDLAERANEVVILADDLASDLRRYSDSVEADPERLASLEDRLDLIQRLSVCGLIAREGAGEDLLAALLT